MGGEFRGVTAEATEGDGGVFEEVRGQGEAKFSGYACDAYGGHDVLV